MDYLPLVVGVKPNDVPKMWEAVGQLRENYREVLGLRYGLNNGSNLSLSQVVKSSGRSRQRVHQIENAAIKELRKTLSSEGVKLDEKGAIRVSRYKVKIIRNGKVIAESPRQ